MNRRPFKSLLSSVTTRSYPLGMLFMTAQTDLRSYRELVEGAMSRAQASGRPEVFENEGPQHARIVVETMLSAATVSLDVLTGAMSTEVWSRESFEAFLSRSKEARLRIVVDEAIGNCDAGSSLAMQMRDHERVDVRVLSGPVDYHLCIADQRDVRLEYDKVSREASVTFGDPTLGKRASGVFDSAWASAVPFEEASTS